MGISSYTSYDCSFPKGSVPQERLEEWANDPYVWVNRMMVDGDEVTLNFDGETGYSSYVLDDLVGLFERPLDEVRGLRLDLHYETTEVDGGFFGCDLHIEGGKCRYEESEIVYREHPMDECPISIGRKS